MHTFLTALYFCFITLSSIGFGDYTPSIGNSLPASQENANSPKGLILDALYYCFVFCWILSGFVCTSVFLDRLGNKAKYAAKVGFEPISAISDDYRISTKRVSAKINGLFSPNPKSKLKNEPTPTEEDTGQCGENCEAGFGFKHRNCGANKNWNEKQPEFDHQIRKRNPSTKPRRSLSLESTSLTELASLENTLFLERHFFPTAFSRDISYDIDRCDSEIEENVKCYTNSDILKSKTGNDMLLC